MNRIWMGLTLAAALVVVGCNGGNANVAKVTGTLTYNGEKVAGANVMFVNDDNSITASGVTNDQGVYELSTFVGGNPYTGGPVGHCRVYVTKTTSVEVKEVKDANGNPDPTAMMAQMVNADGTSNMPQSLLPEKFASPDGSGLEFTIEAGKDNVYDIPLAD